MNVTNRLLDTLWPPSPPPAGGFVYSLPEAFGALDEHGNVYVIGYQGEWYTISKPSLWVRLHNWIVGLLNKRQERSDQ